MASYFGYFVCFASVVVLASAQEGTIPFAKIKQGMQWKATVCAQQMGIDYGKHSAERVCLTF